MLLKIKDALRKLVPSKFKRLAVRILTAELIGSALKKKEWVRCKEALVFVNHPRISNSEAAAAFFGIRERAEIDIVNTALRINSSSTVVELGCSIGVVASNLAKLGPKRLVLVEADQELLALAKKNVSLNATDATEVIFINNAIDYSGSPEVKFKPGITTTSGLVSPQMVESDSRNCGMSVNTIRLIALLERFSIGEYFLISDIEGAESDIWFNDSAALRNCVAIVVELEDTPTKTIQQQIAQLISLGFAKRYEYGRVFLFVKE